MLTEITSEVTAEAVTGHASAGLVGKLIGVLAGIIISGISTMGYAGIVLMMAIESACIPPAFGNNYAFLGISCLYGTIQDALGRFCRCAGLSGRVYSYLFCRPLRRQALT